MEIFIISFTVYILVALAIGIGIMFRGRAMHAGCRSLSVKSHCKHQSLCGDKCRRIK